MRATRSSFVASGASAASVEPGETQFTVTPLRPTPGASAFVIPITPALAAEYETCDGSPTRAASEAIDTIRPKPLAHIFATAACAQLSAPKRQTRTSRSQSAGSDSTNGL